MRELLVTITLLSVVSAEEFGPKKRLGIPPEEDPNFWPTRGRRSYWSDSRLFSNTIRHRDVLQNPEIGYPSHSGSWASGINYLGDPGFLDYLDSWLVNLCPRKKSISLVLPLVDYRVDENDIPGCGGQCSQNRGRGRRAGERWRSQQPLYVEEPRWISIDYDQGVLGGSVGNEDPFIVARGRKRSEVLEARKGRYLEDVLTPDDVDPFFVARGKREAINSGKETEYRTFETGPVNKFDSRLRSIASIKATGSEAGKLSSGNDEKFWKDLVGKPRVVRSSTDIFEVDDSVKLHNDEGGYDFENGVKFAPRYSRPRDKHSNLQRILDEPFFISRGKKGEYYDEERGENTLTKIPNDLEDPDPVLAEISRLYTSFGFSAPDNIVKKSKGPNKPPRNRRGMLDELLTSDDPFYVARGKKLSAYPQPRSQYFDLTINRGNQDSPTVNGKYSIFAKSTRTKLMQKLSDFSKAKSGRNSISLTNDPIIKTI